MDTLQQRFAGHVRARRESLGLSTSLCAEAAGVSEIAWRKWEQGVRWPSADSLQAIAAALDTTPGQLLDGPRPAK